MRIEGLGSIRMLDNDIVAVTAVPAAAAFGNNDRALRRCIDWCAPRCADVDRIPTVQSLGDDTPCNGPDKVLCERRTAAAEEGFCGLTPGNIGDFGFMDAGRGRRYHHLAVRDDD